MWPWSQTARHANAECRGKGGLRSPPCRCPPPRYLNGSLPGGRAGSFFDHANDCVWNWPGVAGQERSWVVVIIILSNVLQGWEAHTRISAPMMWSPWYSRARRVCILFKINYHRFNIGATPRVLVFVLRAIVIPGAQPFRRRLSTAHAGTPVQRGECGGGAMCPG